MFVSMIFAMLMVVAFASPGKFIIEKLDITRDQASTILEGGQTAQDLILDLINEELKRKVNTGETKITIDQGDFIIDQTYPNQTLKPGCSSTVQALNRRAKGIIKSSSRIEGGVESIGSSTIRSFGAAHLDAELRIQSDIRGRLGFRFFGSCTNYARKTVGVYGVTSGRVSIIPSVEASGNISVNRAGANEILVMIRLDFSVYGVAKDWEINSLEVSSCTVRFLGIKLLSFCSLLENKARSEASKYINRFVEIDAPKIFKKMETALNAHDKELVVISLKY